MELFQTGHGETLKGHVHITLCGLAMLCGAYNGIAFLLRRERHLFVNAAVYTALAAYEVAQISRHMTDRGAK